MSFIFKLEKYTTDASGNKNVLNELSFTDDPHFIVTHIKSALEWVYEDTPASRKRIFDTKFCQKVYNNAVLTADRMYSNKKGKIEFTLQRDNEIRTVTFKINEVL